MCEAVTCADGSCVHTEELQNLIKVGEVEDVLEYLDSKNLSGEHFKKTEGTNSYFPPEHRGPFVTMAAASGNVSMVNALISRGFNPKELHFGVKHVSQPILEACRNGHLSVVKLLVEQHDVSVETIDYTTGNRCLHITLCQRASHVYPLTEYLLKTGADVNYYAEIGHQPLHCCVSNPTATPELLLLILAYGANINVTSGRPPLHLAGENGRVDFVNILLDAGANVDITQSFTGKPFKHRQRPSPDISGRLSYDTAFIRATKFNQLPVLKVLYSRGANPEYRNRLGNSALHVAAGLGFYDIARYLTVDIGVGMEAKNYEEETPFLKALKMMHVRIAQMIYKAGYNPKPEELEFKVDNPLLGDEIVSVFVHEIRQLTSTPRSLEDMTALTLRRIFGKNVSRDADRLPIPQKLKDLLKLIRF